MYFELAACVSDLLEHGIRAGQTLPLNIPELEVAGQAIITAIDDCPAIAIGEGSAVTGRFVTRRVDVIVRIEVVGVDGQIDVIEGTPIHPIWSLERNDWVPLGELVQGENLMGEVGAARIIAHQQIRQNHTVFNLEIRGEHVYQIGLVGLVAHNACGHVDGGIATANQALDGAISYLGKGYQDMGLGRFLSADGLRQVRLGPHELNPANLHIHFEHYNIPWGLGGKVIESTFTRIF